VIWLVRHGQTEMNRVGRYQGRLDSPLTEAGVAQAARVGARLAAMAAAEGGDWTIDASPLGRTRQTAAIIAESMDLPVRRHDDRLAEVDFGSWEGLTRDEIYLRRPDLAGRTAVFLLSEDGETYDQLAARVRAWMEEADVAPQHCVAVTHAGVGRMMRGLYLGLTADDMRAMETPQDAVFRFQGGRVERLDCPSAGGRS
jgi:probable phosphoglycerate mutase